MRLTLLFMLVAVSGICSGAERSDPAPHITVFRDGNHVVTLVGAPDGSLLAPLPAVMNERELGNATRRNWGSALGLGRKQFWVRVRVVDGELICEKFAVRYKNESPETRAAELFKESCT